MSEIISSYARPVGTCVVDYWRHALNASPGPDHRVSLPQGETFNAQIRLCRLGPITLVDCRGDPEHILYKAFQSQYLLALTFQIEGESRLTLNRHETLLTAGHFTVHSPASDSELQHLSRYRQISVLIDQSQATKIAHPAALYNRALSARSPLGRLFLDMLQSACAHAPGLNPVQIFDIASVLTSLAGSLLRETINTTNQEKPSAPGRMQAYHIQTIKDYILSRINDPELDVASICAGINLSARYVHHLFSTESMRLMEWLWKTRLNHCARDLASPNLRHSSISSIAFSNGFNDQAHFSRAFRKHFGSSPRQFRNHHLSSTSHQEPKDSAPLVNSEGNAHD